MFLVKNYEQLVGGCHDRVVYFELTLRLTLTRGHAFHTNQNQCPWTICDTEISWVTKVSRPNLKERELCFGLSTKAVEAMSLDSSSTKFEISPLYLSYVAEQKKRLDIKVQKISQLTDSLSQHSQHKPSTEFNQENQFNEGSSSIAAPESVFTRLKETVEQIRKELDGMQALFEVKQKRIIQVEKEIKRLQEQLASQDISK